MSLKKLASLSLALALVYSISLPARAELLKNFKIDGSIETKSISIDNETDFNGTADDYRGETRTRILVGGSFDLLDDVHSRVLLRKNNRLHGQAAETASGVQDNITLDNAYVKIDKVFKHIDLTMGRQFYGDSSDLLIYYGLQPDDLLSVTALDIFRADADLMGMAKFQGIAGKTAETTARSDAGVNISSVDNGPSGPSNANSDSDIWGGELSTDKIIPKGNLGVGYYTAQVKGAGAALNSTLNNAEVKLNGEVPMVGGLSYNAQYVQNFGRNNGGAFTTAFIPVGGALDGNAWIVGLGFGQDMTTKQGAMPIRIHGEYGRGSDDFVSIAPGKRFGKIWGEHTNNVLDPSV